MNWKPGGAALLAFLFLCAAGSVSARHRSHAGESAPATLPTTCCRCLGRRRFACPRRAPPNAMGRGAMASSFTDCGLKTSGVGRNIATYSRDVPDDVVQGIADLMPARGTGLSRMVGARHCMAWTRVLWLGRRARAGISIPPEVSNPNQAVERPPAGSLAHRAPISPDGATAAAPPARTRRAPDSADALRGACRAPQVITRQFAK